MLAQLTQRVAQLGPGIQVRLRTLQSDALDLNLQKPPYDLVATHFFLDCFTEDEIRLLLQRATPFLEANATWVVSEFAVPAEFPLKWFAIFLLSILYRGFGLLTGLRVRRLPNYARLFQEAGFTRVAHRSFLGGLLVSELWKWAFR